MVLEQSVIMVLKYGGQYPGTQRPRPESSWYSSRVVTASLTSRAEMWYLEINYQKSRGQVQSRKQIIIIKNKHLLWY